MAETYSSLYVHLIFSTKDRQPTLQGGFCCQGAPPAAGFVYEKRNSRCDKAGHIGRR